MKKIFRKIGEFFLEEKFCPHCKQYVKVRTIIRYRGNQKVEIKECTQCGKTIEEIILHKE